MKVLLNVDALIPPLTGIGCYTRQLLEGLRHRDELCQLSCFSQSRIVDCCFPPLSPSPDSAPSYNFATMRSFVRRIPGAYQLRSTILDARFRWELRNRFAGAVYHEPNYILRPFDGVAITTVHDLSFIRYPKFHPRERVRYMERELPKTLRRAQHIITDCQYIKNELISLLGVAEEKVSAIPLGVDAKYCRRSAAEVQTVLQKYRLCYGRYLLAVATLEPRKNLHGLITAYMCLPTKIRRRFPLVLVGGRGWHCETLEKQIARLEAAGELRRLGYLPEADLPAIYSAAAAFAFPSFYEGFGLPPLEAMASGVPVLTSDNSAMSEVVGSVGILINPEDNDSIHAGLQRLLLDEQWRQQAATQGVVRAAQFTWKSCVDRTLAVYRQSLD